MTRKSIWKAPCAALAMAATLQTAAMAQGDATLAPAGAPGTVGAGQYRPIAGQTPLSLQQKIALLRQKVKYVFVLFQENRSFDHYFGTYPGANGLFADGHLISAPGTTQRYRKTDGTFQNISPFLIPRSIGIGTNNGFTVPGTAVTLYPEDTYSVDHSHNGYLNDFHLDATHRVAKNDGYALDQQGLHYATPATTDATIVNSSGVAPTSNPSLANEQQAFVVMSHVDCDTIPLLWQYADRFTMFDNFHQTTVGPSTPNAIAMIAGQTGETQWALHPSIGNNWGTSGTGHPAFAVPNATDNAPFPGSNADTYVGKPPYGPDENPANPQPNLTFATLPLSFMGQEISQTIAADPNPLVNLADVQHDIQTIAAKDKTVPWGWYQQGYDKEPYDGTTTADGVVHTLHSSYIVHHNGPQYFGYIGDNPRVKANLHGLQDFYTAVAAGGLPASGGVFYVRGGYYNNDGLITLDPNPTVRAATPGNDDHPNYSDAQISEALVADSVNAIAASKYWSQSAIIVTYDESDGLYDHALPGFRSTGPDGFPLSGGPRIPAIVISPYSAAHTISKVYSEHSSVIRFINELFGLVPLADLPDEQRGRLLGAQQAATFNQTTLGPADDGYLMGDLTEAFDNNRLLGSAPPLPASYAAIPASTVHSLPHYAGAGCKALNITPTDYDNGVPVDMPPADFNPRPSQSPGTPSSGTWTP